MGPKAAHSPFSRPIPMPKKTTAAPSATEPVHLAAGTLPDPAATPSKVNKSEEIRIEARKILDAGGSPRPKEIIEVLARRGIEVVSPQVSQILGRLGVERRPRKKKRDTVPPRSPRAATPPAAPSNEAFTLTDLIAAKKFVEMIGTPRRAMSLLDALDRIS